MRRANHIVRLTVITLAAAATWACIQRPMKLPQPSTQSTQTLIQRLSDSRDVDILFLVDSSGSMSQEQTELKDRFNVLMQTLAGGPEGLPDVHIGVVTPSIGIAPYQGLGNCDPSMSDKGILGMAHGAANGPDLARTCIGEGQRYIVDVAPKGCDVDREADRCSEDSCSQSHCDAMARGSERLVLVHDDKGCPRCRNYEGTLEEVFRCLASVGENGCGFEQQLEAVRLALDESATPQNQGFLRDAALLSVVFITDEDDCSAASPDVLFRPDDDPSTCAASQLGCRDNLRCFEFGMTCDEDARSVGTKTNCRLREESDPNNLLQPISRYLAFFEANFDPQYTLVASISGPVTDQVAVTMNQNGHPDLGPSCAQGGGWEATPSFRIQSFLDGFYRELNDAATPSWAFTSICSGDFTGAMTKIAESINTKLAPRFAMPLGGYCRNGAQGMACAPCLPDCRVTQFWHRGRDDQKRYQVPWCGSLCSAGPCRPADLEPCSSGEGATCRCDEPLYPTKVAGQVGCARLHFSYGALDRDKAPELTELLPVREPSCSGLGCSVATDGRAASCWYVATDDSGRATVKVAAADSFGPGMTAEIACKLVPDKEPLCRDGKDNDQDCLVDDEDPDCAMPLAGSGGGSVKQ